MNSSRVRDQETLRQRRNRHKNRTNERTKLFDTKTKSSNKSQAAEDAKNITKSLLRTKTLLSQELDRVTSLNQTIDEDNSMLQKTSDDHMFLDNVVSGARKALRSLRSQDNRDSVILWSSAAFFYVVVLYVVWTRIRIPFLLW